MAKLYRKNRSRKETRKNRRCGMWGGADESLPQGVEFRNTQLQLGGGHTPLGGAPVGDTGVLESGLRDVARVSGLDASVSAATAHGQQGGRRNVAKACNSRKNRKVNSRKVNSRKNRKVNSRKNRKVNSRKNRKVNSRKNRKVNSRKNRKLNTRKSRKLNTRKSRKVNSRKSRKVNSRKSRKMGGGSRFEGSPLGANPMLLTASEAQKAGTADFNNPFLTK